MLTTEDNKTEPQEQFYGAIIEQFSDWCQSFKHLTVANRIIVRFWVGDALDVCSMLFYQTFPSDSQRFSFPAGSIRTIELDPQQYPNNASRFDMIDTSNLSDYLGLVNILLAVSPLIKKEPQSVVHTNLLLVPEQYDNEHLIEHLTMMDPILAGLIFQLMPNEFQQGFSLHIDHKISLGSVITNGKRRTKRLIWKVPYTCDSTYVSNLRIDLLHESTPMAVTSQIAYSNGSLE
jgi:hypothetical protein